MLYEGLACHCNMGYAVLLSLSTPRRDNLPLYSDTPGTWGMGTTCVASVDVIIQAESRTDSKSNVGHRYLCPHDTMLTFAEVA